MDVVDFLNGVFEENLFIGKSYIDYFFLNNVIFIIFFYNENFMILRSFYKNEICR